VTPIEYPTSAVEASRALVQELLSAGFVLIDLLSTLVEDLPDDAFPEEEKAAVLIEMLAGSAVPAVQAAGERTCWEATALVGALRDRAIDDLEAALEIAREREEREGKR
jgi:hypothetical protein